MSLRDEFRESEVSYSYALCSYRLNRIELQKIYNKAAKAELERDYDRAFRLYIKAAEGFLYLDRSATEQAFRTACKSEAAKALERAEKLKAVRQNLTPVVADSLSEGLCDQRIRLCFNNHGAQESNLLSYKSLPSSTAYTILFGVDLHRQYPGNQPSDSYRVY